MHIIYIHLCIVYILRADILTQQLPKNHGYVQQLYARSIQDIRFFRMHATFISLEFDSIEKG